MPTPSDRGWISVGLRLEFDEIAAATHPDVVATISPNFDRDSIGIRPGMEFSRMAVGFRSQSSWTPTPIGSRLDFGWNSAKCRDAVYKLKGKV